MNAKLTVSILLMCLVSTSIAQPTIYQQLCKLNKEWHNIEPTEALLEQKVFQSEEAIITYHLQQVEQYLNQKEIIHLSQETIDCRKEGLEVLHGYWQKGLYPKNNHLSYQVPFFIDDASTACAVGYIMQGTGHEALAEYIAETQNNAYVKEMVGKNIFAWATSYGFTVDELAWIQPAYGPCWNGQPWQGNTLHPTCGNSDGSVEIVVSDGTTYEWAHGASDLQLNNLVAGIYTISGTYNYDKCPFELNIILENEDGADLTTNVMNHQTCDGIEDGAAEVSVANANGSYDMLWSNGSITNDANNLATGNHFVTVTDQANCISIERIWISLINGFFGDEQVSGSICNSNTGSIDLLNIQGGAGTGFYNYSWSDGSTNATRTNLTSNNYDVIISDDAGCFIEKNITVYDDCDGRITCADDFQDVNNQTGAYIPILQNDIDPSPANVVQGIISQPTYGFVYESSFTLIYPDILDENTLFFYYPYDNTYTGPDSFTYTFCTDYGFCDSATVYLNVVAEPVVQAFNIEAEDLIICEGEEIQLIATGAQDYSWSPNTGLDQNTGSFVLASPTETTTYTVTGTTAEGETDSYEITIQIGSAVTPSISDLPAFVNLNDSPVTLIGNPAGGIFSGNGVFFSAFNPILAGPGVHEITYTYTDESTGCLSETTESILTFTVIFNFVNYNLGTIAPKYTSLTIETHTETLGEYDFYISDLNGQIVSESVLNITNNKQLHQINNIDVPLGMYIAKIGKNGEYFSKQLVIGK